MGTTVLIVDDHPGFRSAARLLLEASGYVIVGEAGDGQTAVDAARRLRPDVVLCDVDLGDGPNGFAVAAALDDSRVVLMSSRDYDVPRFIAKSELSDATLSAVLHG